MASELLKGLRMLDLTDEKGAMCGKMFRRHGRRSYQGRAARRMLDASHPAVSRRQARPRPLPVFDRLSGRQKIRDRESRYCRRARTCRRPRGEIRFSGRVASARPSRFDRARLRRARQEKSATHLRFDHAVRRQWSGQRLQVGRYYQLGGRRHDVPDGRRRKAADSDEPAASWIARGRRGRRRHRCSRTTRDKPTGSASASSSTCRPASCGR